MTLLGTIVVHDGMICLETAPNCWFPLNGPSGVAQDFRDTFGNAQLYDVDKRVYRSQGVLQMENDQQVQERLRK